MQTKRNIALDIIRCIAIILVVLIHSSEAIGNYEIQRGILSVSLPMWIAQTFIFIIGRLGVPLFLMLTGALMLGREYESYSCFFKKKILPLIGISVTWFFLYFLLQRLLSRSLTGTTVLKDLLRSILFDDSAGSHLWYLPIIVGIYLFLPLMNKLVEVCKTKELVIYSSIAVGISTLPPVLNLFIALNTGKYNLIKIDQIQQGMLLSLYPLFVIFGYLCHKHNLLRKIPVGALWGVLLGAILVVEVLQYQFYTLVQQQKVGDVGNYLWYNNFFIFIGGVALFEILSRLRVKNKILTITATSLSLHSFGIYLVHMVFLLVFSNWAKTLPLTMLGNTAVLFVIGLLGSWATTWIFSKIPGLNRLFVLSPKKKQRTKNT